MSQNLSSAAIVIGALRVKLHVSILSASLPEIRFWQNDTLLALVHIIRGYLYSKFSFGYVIIGYTVGIKFCSGNK